jgi:hypothetical protein
LSSAQAHAILSDAAWRAYSRTLQHTVTRPWSLPRAIWRCTLTLMARFSKYMDMRLHWIRKKYIATSIPSSPSTFFACSPLSFA